ncbi:MAG: leucine--tRNA ligase [Pirellula sp.]|nr:leucine--tRNA ligase [Pirellula sp.]
MPRYNPAVVEPKWQQYWEAKKTFAAAKSPVGPKLYVLDMFPYPSGNGLHVGHPEGYTATDIVCRFERMNGKSVLHPMGWDAFGLPAEQHAIKTQQPPRVTTEKNIATFRRQLKSLGFSYDWDREVSTTDVEYFRWTQWIFLQLFDTWYDTAAKKGRPIAELPIPAEVSAQGGLAVDKYRDEHRLAYQLEAPVNWCPNLGTVLANEEVIGGVSERGGHPVVRIPLRQWMLRITAYADRLESDLEGLDWSEGIKALQRNWIGRSTGAEVDFYIGREPGRNGKPHPAEFKQWRDARGASGFPRTAGPEVLRVFTTRPDTLYGATYVVVAPEHPLVERLTMPDRKAEVQAYCEQAARKSDLDRTDLAKHKTGVFTGSFAANPANNRPVPVWIADYVLAGYGTGAIMAVPAHDERDYAFAKQFDLPIIPVVDPGEGSKIRAEVLGGALCYADHGTAMNSSEYDGTPTAEFKTKITAELARRGEAREAVNYKLRDWLFSRQHFWGEPFPILHELDDAGNPTGRLRAIAPESLPVNLPPMTEFKPHGRPEPPLEEAPQDWLYVTLDGKRYKRETNTMPQWAGSCWYFLRFIDPKNSDALIDPALEKAWMPVDLYIGGAEHAVLHLLYARFWHKVLFDRGIVTMREPFQKLVNQGMILGELEITGYQRADGSWVSARDVKEGENEKSLHRQTGEELRAVRVASADAKKEGDSLVLVADAAIRLDSRAYKMSKSRGNVINPDDVVKEYGADSLRLYEMFMGPLEATKPWATTGVNGVRGFLDRVWRMIVNDRADELEIHPAVQAVPLTEEQDRILHRTIRDVTQDIRRLSFNTAIAKMMEFTNFYTGCEVRPREAMEKIVLLLSPLAPHIAEELWELLGHPETLAYEPWPTFDEAKIRESTIEIPVQILGKVRGRIIVPADADDAAIEAAARADEKIAPLLEGKTIVKTIIAQKRLVNFVVK